MQVLHFWSVVFGLLITIVSALVKDQQIKMKDLHIHHKVL